MYVLGNPIIAIVYILDRALALYTFVLIVAVLVSWVSPDPYNPIVRFLRSISEPLFAWVRNRLPFVVVGMIDLSPIVAFALISLIRIGILPSVAQFGRSLL